MKLILKCLLLPIIGILGISTAVSSFLLEKITWLLNLVSGFLFFCTLLSAYQSFTVKEAILPTVMLLVLSFICSPYGMPSVLAWVIALVEKLKQSLENL